MVCRGESVCLELLSVLNPMIQKEDTSENIYQRSVAVSQKVEQPSIMVCASRRDTKRRNFLYYTLHCTHGAMARTEEECRTLHSTTHTYTKSRRESISLLNVRMDPLEHGTWIREFNFKEFPY